MKKILQLLIIISLASCGTHKYTNVYSPNSPEVYKTEIPAGEKSSLIINSIIGYDGEGGLIQIQESFSGTLFNEIREFKIFEQVLYNTNVSGINNPINVDVKIVEDYDNRYLANLWKAALIGFSLFTITPFININSDYSLEYEFTFHKGEEVRVITTKCSKEVSRKLFSDESDADMITKVKLELNKDIENKIRADLDFFIMQSD